jgi:methylmalonyl-CoA/ethylmalonyl-CoA epimerase
VVRNYSDILGMGPWGLLLNEPPLLHDLTYKGKPGNFTMTAAFGPGDVQLEPIEPHSGENIYADFIKEHGEGIHHLQFISTNMDETIELMSESGYHVLQGAWFNDGRAAYFDTVDELKCIWEAVQLPTIMPPVEHYP